MNIFFTLIILVFVRMSCNKLINIFKDNLILDLSMSFFHRPKIKYYFNSCRKFFGVPDGAYIHGISLNNELKTNTLLNTNHLNNRLTKKKAYDLFLRNESLISSQLHKMSQFTLDTMCLINYELVKQKRIENFNFLNSKIGKNNILSFPKLHDEVPHYYPYLPKRVISINDLIDKGLFVPNIWKIAKNDQINKSTSLKLFEKLLPLPIDQRYNSNDMNYIIHILSK